VLDDGTVPVLDVLRWWIRRNRNCFSFKWLIKRALGYDDDNLKQFQLSNVADRDMLSASILAGVGGCFLRSLVDITKCLIP
jgi:hypothetical protein